MSHDRNADAVLLLEEPMFFYLFEALDSAYVKCTGAGCDLHDDACPSLFVEGCRVTACEDQLVAKGYKVDDIHKCVDLISDWLGDRPRQ